ncbi:hypothetical protein RclHR1_12530006 [Rhizophagus clarus]|uniref:Uncharacterized protein n=1 Tax=Rhizophagus clarus TaxID=94130 RepID=A0A2Z6QMF8_9GLOM|nr:hypothetical protein RclHR1_12530006 [Rhizophagus clarus]
MIHSSSVRWSKMVSSITQLEVPGSLGDPILTQDYDKQDSFKDQGLKPINSSSKNPPLSMKELSSNGIDQAVVLPREFCKEFGKVISKNAPKKDSGAQGSPKSSSKPGSSRFVKCNPPSKNKNKKMNNSSLDKADILKLVLSLLS